MGSKTQEYKGQIIVLNKTTGLPEALTAEIDSNGGACLRVVPVVAYAYDSDLDKYKANVTLQNRDTKRFKIADAVQIRDTIEYFDLITHAELTAEEIREYNEISIAIRDGHNQVGNVGIYLGFSAANGNDFINPFNGSKIYYKEAVLSADIDYLHFVSENVGEGGSAIPIPALKCVKDNLIIMLIYNVAPTSGDVTIVVEMRK